MKMVGTLMLLVFSCGCVFPNTVSAVTSGIPAGFGKGLSTHKFQTWDDWVKKRNKMLASPDVDRLKLDHHQPLHKFIAKRSSVLPGNHVSPSAQLLQSWSNWMQKRGFGIGETFAGSSGMPHNHLQGWGNWITKRGFGIGNPFPGMSRASKNDLQNWQDWLQKRGFGISSTFPGFSNEENSNFQRWNTWLTKRGFGLDRPFPSSLAVGKGDFQNWENWMEKKGFGIGESFPGSKNTDHANFQRWQNWLRKRGFGIGETFPGMENNHGFKIGAGNTPTFQNWNSYIKRYSAFAPFENTGENKFQKWGGWFQRLGDGESSKAGSHHFGTN